MKRLRMVIKDIYYDGFIAEGTRGLLDLLPSHQDGLPMANHGKDLMLERGKNPSSCENS